MNGYISGESHYFYKGLSHVALQFVENKFFEEKLYM